VGVMTRCLLAVCVLMVPSATLAECVTRSMRITFYTCAEGSWHCLTKRGHQPIPFRAPLTFPWVESTYGGRME
jgi:hypothetical protein